MRKSLDNFRIGEPCNTKSVNYSWGSKKKLGAQRTKVIQGKFESRSRQKDINFLEDVLFDFSWLIESIMKLVHR